MKKIFLITGTFCLFFLHSKADEQNAISIKNKVDTLPTAQLITFLQNINVESYYSKPVDSFILAIDAIPRNMKVYGGSNSQGALFRASYLWYEYSGGAVIRIYVYDFTHMNKYSATATWDVNLFRKEKIEAIEIWKDQNSCINGSCKLWSH